jgi:CRP-like cAMP-binding protein
MTDMLASPFGRSAFARAELGARHASLVDLDPELFMGLGPRELARVREIAAHVVEVGTGEWEPRVSSSDTGLGLLVLDGLLTRRVSLGDDASVELVGAGDLIRPWDSGDHDFAIVPCESAWAVIVPARLAVLGRRLALAAAECPGLVAALLERSGRRERSQGIMTAIAHMKRIDVRVLVLLWHLAERWGHVTKSGVVVPLRLTHQRIADLVGAQRPSVTAALTRMTGRGLVRRTGERGYVLTDAAREELDVLCRDGERAAAPVIATAVA